MISTRSLILQSKVIFIVDVDGGGGGGTRMTRALIPGQNQSYNLSTLVVGYRLPVCYSNPLKNDLVSEEEMKDHSERRTDEQTKDYHTITKKGRRPPGDNMTRLLYSKSIPG